MRPYYDHDFLWEKRKVAMHPVWGSNSHRVYRSVLGHLAHLAPDTKSILDVGCGAGAFGVLASEAGYDYFGVDDSAVAIALGEQSYPGVRLAVADAVHSDFLTVVGAQQFPIITCVNVLHCLTGTAERLALLSHLHAAAKTQGILVLTTMIGPVHDDDTERRLPRAYKLPEEITEEFIQTGWHDVQVLQQSAADQFSKIGNLALSARKIE